MKFRMVLSTLTVIAFVAAAQAHTHLQKATPADGSVITASPQNVVLKFSEPARLTAAWIQKGQEAKRKLGPLPEKLASEVTIALSTLTPGSYVVSWQAVSDDGHVMPGHIRFTLSSAAAHP